MLKKYRSERRYAIIIIVVILIEALLSHVVFPIADDLAFKSMTLHEAMRAYDSPYTRSYMIKDKQIIDKMAGLSVDSINDINELQDARFLSTLSFVGSRVDYSVNRYTLQEHEIEYAKKISDSIFAVIYTAESDKKERIYLCLFFEYKQNSSALFNYTGISLWVTPALVSSAEVSSVYSNWKKVGSYIKDSFEGVFGYGYILPDKENKNMYLSSSYKEIINFNDNYTYGNEHYLLSDGIASFSLDTDLKISDFQLHKDNSFPPFEGDEFAAFLAHLREMVQ